MNYISKDVNMNSEVASDCSMDNLSIPSSDYGD